MSKVKKVYDILSEKYNLGSLDDFSAMIDDEQKRKKIYDIASESYNLGDFDTFNRTLGYAPSSEEIQAEMQPQEAIDSFNANRHTMYNGLQDYQTNFISPEEQERRAREEARLIEEERLQEESRQKMRGQLQENGTIDALKEMKREARFGKLSNLGLMMMNADGSPTSVTGGMGKPQVEIDLPGVAREHRENKVIYETLDEALDKARAGEIGGIGKNDVGNEIVDFGLGLWDGASRLSTWDFGVSNTLKGLTIADVLNKYEQDPSSLTATEQKMLDAMGMATAIQELYQDQTGVGYGVGESLPVSGGFMLQMALNPASGIGKAAARHAVRRYGRNSIAKNLARVGGDIAETGIMTMTTGLGSVAGDALNRINGRATYDIDENGMILYGGQKDQETVGKAVLKGIGSKFIENYTEAVGNYMDFDPLYGMMKGVADKGLRKLNLNKWADALTSVDPATMSASMRSLKEKIKFDGVLGEIMEEEIGMAMNALFVGDNKWSDFLDSETQLTTILSCTIMSAALNAYGGMQQGKVRRAYERNLDNTEREAQRVLGEGFADLRDRIDLSSPEQAVDVLNEVYQSQDYTLEQKRKLAEYAVARVGMQYYNATEAEARRKLLKTEQNVRDAYESGRAAQLPAYYDIRQEYDKSQEAIDALSNADEVWNAINQAARSNAEERENILNGLSETDRALAWNYLYNASRMSGAINHRAEQIEDLVDEYVGQVNPFVVVDEEGNHNVTTAVYGDNVVYVMAQDANGNATIITNDGRKKMVNVSDLEHMQTRNADEMIELFRQQAKAAVDQETDKNLEYPEEVKEPQVGLQISTREGKQWVVKAVEGDNVSLQEAAFDNKSGEWVPSGEPKVMPYKQFMDWQMAEYEKTKENTYKQGEDLTFYVKDTPIGARVNSITPDGKYLVQIENLIDGLDKSIVDEYDADELRKLTTMPTAKAAESNNLSANNAQNETTSTEQIEQSVSEEVTDGQNIEIQPTEEAVESVAPAAPQTARERVPKDEEGNPIYEQTDADTAWDAIVEETEGNVEMAQSVAEQMLANKKAALEKLQKGKAKAGANVAQIIANEKKHQETIAKAEADVKAWERISQVNAIRQQKAELERAAAEKAEAEQRKAEGARILAEQEEQARIEREQLNGVPDMVDDVPADARARGYRRVNGHKVDRQGVLPSLQGKEVGVKFANDMIADGHVAVIEAETLQPSHLQGQRNPAHFIDEAQPKERNDEASIASARKIASNIRPEEITTSVTAYTGAPTVNMRGEAIQGNSRSDALRVMWAEHPDQAERYKQYLIDHAEEFGLNAEEVAAMQHPVLVNMLDVSDADAINLGQYVAQDTESGGTERIKPKNVARKMGSDIRSYANILLHSSDEEASFSELVDKNGVEALKWMNAKGYITPTQYASAFDSKGNMTAEAKNDLRGILYQSIFQGGNTQLEEQFNAMPAKAQKAILATAYRDYESPNSERMIAEIQSSIRAYYALSHDRAFVDAKNYKEAKEAMLVWSRQYQMDDVTGESFLPSENFSNFALELAVVYKGWTQTNIQSHFNNVYDLVQGTKEASLFEEADNTPRTLAGAIEETFNIEYNGQLNSNSLAVDSQDGQAGERGSDGDTESGERAESGEGSADSGRGTDAAREQGEVNGKRKVTANYFEMAEEAQKNRKSKNDKDAQQTNQNLQEERKEGAATTGAGKSRPNGTFSISYYTQFLKELFQNARWEERPSEEVAGIIRRHNAGKTLLARTEDERELLSALRALTNNEIQDELSNINNALQSDEYTDEEKAELERAKNLITRFINRGERNAVIEALTGAKLGEKLPLSKIDELFEMYNSDANVAELYARVRAIAEKIGLDFWFEEMEDSLLGGYLHSDNRVRLNAHMLYCPRMQRQGVASAIVHEMLHAVAGYAVYTQKDIKLGLTPKVQLSKQVLSAANTLINIYEKAVKGNTALVHQEYDIEKEEWIEVADYGTTSVHEMLSEISNPDFRDKLKQIEYKGRSVWQRIWDAIKSMFTKSSDVANPTAYDSMVKALDVLINEFSVDAYQKYSGLEESAMKLSAEENLRFREKEEPKELIAVHNISEDNLKKVLEAGSLIMPSIAITKADMGHTGFGEISLLFDKSTINPSDRRNKVYGGDAWTPRFPQIGIKLNENVVQRIKHKVYGVITDSKLRDTYSISAETYPTNIEDTLTRNGIDGFYSKEWMKLVYLLDRGNKIKVPMKMLDYGNMSEVIMEMAKDMGLTVAEIQENSREFYDNNPDFVAALKIAEDHEFIDSIPEEKREAVIKLLSSKELTFAHFDSLISKAFRMEYDLKHGGLKQIVDKRALSDLIEKRVKTSNNDYNKWVDELFDGIVEKRGIRNNRDWYTPSGNSRSWEQLYDPATPANILKYMLAENEQGGSGGFFDSNIMGASAETYESIEEIREKGKKRLKQLPYEEYDEWSNSVAERMAKICDDFLSPSQKNSIGGAIDAKIEITNAVAKDKTAKGIYKHMKREYPNFTMEHAKQVEEIVKEIQEFATGYFEAKPQRLVSVNEVMAAVVPSNASKGIVDALKSNGIEVVTYKKGDEEARKRVVKRVSSSLDIRFRDGAPFFSNAERAVENIKQQKATPEQWLAMIKKDGGLKAGEDKWMGLSDWLNEQKEKGVKTLTKDEVLAFIRENQIEIEEVEYEEGVEDARNDAEEAIRESLQEMFDAKVDEVHNENPEQIYMSDIYEEAFERVCAEVGYDKDDAPFVYTNATITLRWYPIVTTDELLTLSRRLGFSYEGSPSIPNAEQINSTRLDYTTEGLDNKREIALVVPTIESWNESDTVHFGDAGEGRAVAWVRFGETTDEEGNRVLVIDEVQSKRHDEGRAKGYQSKEKGELLAERGWLYDKMYSDGLTEEEFNRRNEINARLEELGEGRIPDAPFDKNYHELAMKRMLRYAAENGFDKVAWTKGAQQAKRYGLNKVVDTIDASNFSSDTERDVRLTYTNEQQDNLLVRMSDGVVVKGDIDGSSVEGQKLFDIIGKDAADKLLSTTDDMEIKGDGLNFGGEDRNALYDEMVPRFMNKYTKKWGTKVGEVTLPNVEKAGRTMWSVDVTPEMKESVMQGQPMFREGMGAISDREVSYENDPIAKFQGKPRYYGKRASAFAERERRRMENAAKEAAEMLGIEAEIITDASTLQGRKAKAKGWYDIINKKVVVVVPNHVSMGDAVRTVLHEGVAHHGLRELFGDGFDAMLDNVYNNVAPELKARIDAIAERTGVSTSVATEEYLASLAETTNFEEAQRRGWWAKIKQYFVKMLDKLGMPGLNLKEELTDNELRYLLWRSYKNLVEPNSYLKPLGYIDDVAKQKELKVGEYSEKKQAAPMAAEMSEAEEWAAVTVQRIDELEAQAAQLENEISEMEAKREADDASRYDMWEGLMMPLRMQLEDVYAEIEGLYTLSGEEEVDEEERETEKQRQLYQKRIDNAYLKAVREGDWEEATDLFRQYVLSKAEDEGIVPMDYGVGYRGGAHSSIAKKVKEENPDAIAEAAYQMSIRIPKGSILVPMPSRTGNATYTVKLAEAIAKATDSEVRDILKGKARMSVYEAKQKGVKMTPEDLGMYTTEELPKGKNIVIIDNVIDKGTTALAAVSAVKGASVVAYAYTLGDKQRVATLKLAEPVTYDDNKRIIPLSQRFNKETDDIRYRLVDDPAEIERLESEPTIKAYRAMQVINGELYPPMSAVVDGKLREPIALGQWEQSEERPDLADDNGRFKLDKGNKKSLKAAYNPYFHSSSTPLNDQFSEAQDRDNLVTVEVEVPVSEVDGTSGYKAEKAKDAVGTHQWKAGIIQGQLTGTREVFLTRWDKPIRIVPESEVADVIVEMFDGKDIVMPSNVVTPQLRKELEARGITFVETDNQGKLVEGENKGEHYAKVYGKKANRGLRYKAEDSLESQPMFRTAEVVDEGPFSSEEKINAITEEAANLGVKVRVANNASELHPKVQEDIAKGRPVKGYYDTRTGEVVIYAPHATSTNDVKRTILHEVVGHKGLRKLLGEDNFNKMMVQMYQMLPEEERKKVWNSAVKKYGDLAEAMEEYFAEKAENLEKPKWWQKVLTTVKMWLHNKFGVRLTDADINYLLWRSKQRLAGDTAVDMAVDAMLKRAAKQSDLTEAEIKELEEAEMRLFEKSKEARDLRRRTGDAAREYENAVNTTAYRSTEAFRDDMRALKVLQEAVAKESGKEIRDFENPYMAENRMSSINLRDMEMYKKNEYNKLLKAISDLMALGAKYDEITDYMMAKHGLERNEVFARRDAARDAEGDAMKEQQLYDENRKTDYAGLTALTGESKVEDAERAAQQMVDEFEQKYGGYPTAMLWTTTRSCNHKTLEITYNAGLINKETYEELKNQFEYYIPLRGFAETTAEEVYFYVGGKDSPYNAAIETARGRKSKADVPIATIGSIAESAITDANRNRMKMEFYNMAVNHKTDLISISDVWIAYDAATDAWVAQFPDIPNDATPEEVKAKMEAFEARMEAQAAANPNLYAKASEKPHIPYRVVKKADMNEHQVIVKKNGRDVVMTINGNPRAAQAINGLTNPEARNEWYNKAFAWVNRNLSANFTTRNPAFVISNFVRDGIYTNSMVWVKESPMYAKRYHKNFGKSTANIASLVKKYKQYEAGDKGALDMNDPMQKMFLEFMTNGGETGYTAMHSVDAYKRMSQKELKKMLRKGALATGEKVVDVLKEGFDTFGRWAEDTSRFAAYMTSREMGRSVARSIYDAKEISVNFNKKGSGSKMRGKFTDDPMAWLVSTVSQTGRNFYVFWNAGVQGLTNFGRAAVENKGKFAVMAMAAMAAGVLIPVLFSSDDDDDDEYYLLPEYVRRNNICFKVGKKQFLTLPLPIEMRALYGMGELAYSFLSGKEELTAGELTTKIIQQMSQVMPIDMMADGGGLKALIPSAIKPAAEAAMNVNWTGEPIYKEETVFNENYPTWMLSYKSTSPELVWLSRQINEATNENTKSGAERTYDRGWADDRFFNNPAVWEHIWEGYLGGIGTITNQTKKTLMMPFDEDLREVRNIPVVSRFVKTAGDRAKEYTLNEEYYGALDVADKLGDEVSAYKREARDVNNPNREEMLKIYTEMAEEVNNVTAVTNKLKKKVKELESLQKSNPDEVLDFNDKETPIKEVILALKQQVIETVGSYMNE